MQKRWNLLDLEGVFLVDNMAQDDEREKERKEGRKEGMFVGRKGK